MKSGIVRNVDQRAPGSTCGAPFWSCATAGGHLSHSALQEHCAEQPVGCRTHGHRHGGRRKVARTSGGRWYKKRHQKCIMSTQCHKEMALKILLFGRIFVETRALLELKLMAHLCQHLLWTRFGRGDTLPKTKKDPEKGTLKDCFPLQTSGFQGPMLVFSGDGGCVCLWLRVP